ncbi:MAG: metallophosphoesterase [Fibromonadaceae bacterium]|jgi:DNA repair exonuclease SbcCD nuclease subunit|nr:metallophosphoesterase [Fibromonadaceae bacterium]
MKFLHCNDLHLGKKPSFGSEIFKSKRFEDYFAAFERIIEQAKEHKVETILVAGDFFDKKETHPNILSNTEGLLQKCKEYKIEVVVIEGNHDLIYRNKEAESWLIYLENKNLLRRPFVKFLENNEKEYHSIFIGETEIFGLGYPGASVDSELLEFADYCEKNNKQNCVVLVHTALGNNEFIGGFLKDKSVLDKMQKYAIYIAGGHGHRLQKYPETQPFFFVAGAPEYCDLGEKLALKTAIIFDTNSKEHKILMQNPRSCISDSISLECASAEQFREEFDKFLPLLNISTEDIVIIEINTISNDFIPDIKWAEKRILEKGALFAEVKWKRNLFSKSLLAKRNSVEEIELEQIKKWPHWGNAADSAAKALSEMKKSINDEQFDISSIFDSALNSVIEGSANNQ